MAERPGFETHNRERLFLPDILGFSISAGALCCYRLVLWVCAETSLKQKLPWHGLRDGGEESYFVCHTMWGVRPVLFLECSSRHEFGRRESRSELSGDSRRGGRMQLVRVR